MSLLCPRCSCPLESFSRAAGGAATVLADMCPRCGGVWLDGGEVAPVYPALAELPARLADLATRPQASGGIGGCPRCAARPVQFPFFEVHLDACPGCLGLWVDGDELIDLARSRDRMDGLPAPAVQRGGYRQNAAAATRAGLLSCKQCGAEVPVRATTMTSAGAMCAPCAERFERDRDRSGDGGEVDEEPRVPMRSFFSFGEGDGASGADLLTGLGIVFGAVLDASARCPRCGCGHHSRCGH